MRGSDSSVRFNFVPESDRDGVDMQNFTINVWQGDSLVAHQGVQSADPTTTLKLASGRYSWSVQWQSTKGIVSDVARSQVVVAPQADAWEGVPWLGAEGSNEFSATVTNISKVQPVELMAATLGFGYVTVNGREVSNDLLSYSGWTNTEKRVLYRTYDVTDLVADDGTATVEVRLGCGYRCDSKGQHRMPAYRDSADRSHDSIAKIFRLQIQVGGDRIFHSGSDSWQSRQGPVVEDSLYDGETYNAQATTAWTPAKQLSKGWGPKGAMVAASFPGVKVTRTDPPVKITNPTPGVHVVDFGSNVAGVCKIDVPRVPTEPGSISLKHGEIMQHEHLPDVASPDPSRVYFGNLRSAQALDTLYLDAPVKGWMPRFTYHGFRFVEVYNYPGELTMGSIQRLVMHTANADKAEVKFDDEVLQAIHEGSKGSQKSNLMQIPTDCPQRDERLGWMGDVSLSAESMLLHFNMVPMAAAYLDSMVDEMHDDGSLPDVVPFQRFGNFPADLSWSAALTSTLTALWQEEGDLDSARKHWGAVKSNTVNLQAQYQKAGALNKLAEPHGDWCPPPATPGGRDQERPSRGFAAAFSLVRAIQQAADLGEALGGDAADVAKTYAQLAATLREEFHTTFYDSSKQQYDNGVMVTSVLPLALGAVPDSEHDAVVQTLLDHVAAKNGTWTGGIINNRFLFDVLHDEGHGSLALSMLKRRDYPSYGYMYFNDLEPAKECMWELPDGPYQGTGMNSRNHHMFSSVGHYLVTRVAGLSNGPKAREFTAVVGSEPSSSATLRTSSGVARFAWSRAAGEVAVHVVVPVGMQARLHVPVTDGFLRQGVADLKTEFTSRHRTQYTLIILGHGKHEFSTEAKHLTV